MSKKKKVNKVVKDKVVNKVDKLVKDVVKKAKTKSSKGKKKK